MMPPKGELQVLDHMECKFNVNSFKMVYVVSSESFLYKRMVLTRTHQVGIIYSSGLDNSMTICGKVLLCSNVSVDCETDADGKNALSTLLPSCGVQPTT